MQWGKQNFTSDTQVTVYYPIAFSNPLLFVPVQYQRGGGDQDNNMVLNETMTAGYWTARLAGAGGGSPMTISWIAFGS
jgi:hypothetical protein